VNLSPNFTLEELTASQVATRRGINNSAPAAVVQNLTLLAATLERVRAWVNRPLIISSGYRCPVLNQCVGGAPASAHVLGLAADITCSGLAPQELARLIRASHIPFDQLIYEGSWVHLGLSTGAPRQQVLTAHFDNGRATYSQGITA
jgi:zinc D-Ala-D-Ala carboxypeptidase